jgi:hypothetical protein
MTAQPFASSRVDGAEPDQRFEYGLIGAARPTTLDDVVRRRIGESATLEQVARCLFSLLTGGYSGWEDGRLLSIRVLVERIGPLRVVIHTREHGPPHFHVVAPGINAAFAITDCALLTGHVGAGDLRLIQYWHAEARPLLVKVWNASRPSDCPVGPLENT